MCADYSSEIFVFITTQHLSDEQLTRTENFLYINGIIVMKDIIKRRIPYLVVFCLALGSGISLVLFPHFFRGIRGSAGDFLIVIFIYASKKIFFSSAQPVFVAVSVFIFAVIIELLQYNVISRFFNTKIFSSS